MMENKTYL